MRTETWKCDRCGVQGEGSSPLHLRLYGIDSRLDEIDLCSDCIWAMVRWVGVGADVFKCSARRCKGSWGALNA